MKNYVTGEPLDFLKMLILKVIIVNSIGFYFGVPIGLLAISWSLNVYFVFRMVNGVRKNIKTEASYGQS
jgi:hypothetical protein